MPVNLLFKQLSENEIVPYDLLLLADPSKTLIDAYLKDSEVFVAKYECQIVGVIVLLPVNNSEIEIKNIVVLPEMQGKGVGTYLLENSINFSNLKQYKSIIIGTANSSINQLNLYQKLSFVMYEVKKDFFLKNYPEPIYENGLQARDMIMLRKEL